MGCRGTQQLMRPARRPRAKGEGRCRLRSSCVFFFQAEDGIRDLTVTGVQTCALPIYAKGTRKGLAFFAESRPVRSTTSFHPLTCLNRTQNRLQQTLFLLPNPRNIKIGRASCRERV